MKKSFKLITTFLFGILLMGCGGEDKNKTVLNVYTGLEEEYLNYYIDLYERKFPDVELNIIRDSQGAIAAKVLAEGENPVADVLWGLASVNLIDLAEQGRLAELDTTLLENIDPVFVDSISSTPKWVGMTAWTSAIIANKYELADENLPIPQSYEDLLDPRYDDEVIMPNPASSGTGYLTVLGWISIWGEEKAWEYMDKLHKNIGQYTHSGSAPVKMVMQGEELVGIGMDSESMRLGKISDAIVTILPAEGYGWDMEGIAVIQKENIKSEAIEFLKWSLSQEMMEEYSKNIGIVSYKGINTKLEGYPADFREKLAKTDFKWASENRERILKEWEKRYGKGE